MTTREPTEVQQMASERFSRGVDRTPVFGRHVRWNYDKCASCGKKNALVVPLGTCGYCTIKARHG